MFSHHQDLMVIGTAALLGSTHRHSLSMQNLTRKTWSASWLSSRNSYPYRSPSARPTTNLPVARQYIRVSALPHEKHTTLTRRQNALEPNGAAALDTLVAGPPSITSLTIVLVSDSRGSAMVSSRAKKHLRNVVNVQKVHIS